MNPLYSAILRQVTMKILFLIPYPLHQAPSQRFRFEQYFAILKSKGHQIRTQSFLSASNWQLFFRPGHPFQKLWILLIGYLKRIYAIGIAPSFDFIFIHRETAPLGPPIFEWILAKILLKKIIYDFDDAIWLTDRVSEPALLNFLKWRSKVKSICRWSYKVSCGNDYLKNFTLPCNPKAIYNPTTIDDEANHNPSRYHPKKIDGQVVIGWTGSHSTLKYLQGIELVLQKIESQFSSVSFLVIADQAPELQLNRLTFVKWNANTEVEDLLNLDIGIMPLPDDEWAKGKCGFKALQYMALQIPTVASPVGVNVEIIKHGENGLLASSEEEWTLALQKLIEDKILRDQLGENGQQTVIKNYSVASNSSTFLSLFE